MSGRLPTPLHLAFLAAASGSAGLLVPAAFAQVREGYVAAVIESETLRPQPRPEYLGWVTREIAPPARRPGAAEAVVPTLASALGPVVLPLAGEAGAGLNAPAALPEVVITAVPAAEVAKEVPPAGLPEPVAAPAVTGQPVAAAEVPRVMPLDSVLAAPFALPGAGPAFALPQAAPADPAEAALMAGVLPQVSTRNVEAKTWATDRSLLERRWVAAGEKPQKVTAALDLAQLYIGVMLLPEALDWLARARSLGAKTEPAAYARLTALEQVASVLARRGITRALPDWPGGGLWQVAAGQTAGLSRGEYTLEEAVAGLNDHSQAVITRLIPLLFDVILEARDYRLAEALLRGAQARTRLEGMPVWGLMMGQLALGYDMPQQAFDHFARAADGRDLSAQKARIALADLALTRKDPKLLPALRDILREGVNQWRYGREALVLRARLAQVAEDLGDIPMALDIMGKIRLDHPGTPEAILAHERGALALAAFAVAMDAEEIDLYTYLHSLRDVEAFYRLDPVWPIARLSLARAWSRAGLHEAAAAEYAALQSDFLRQGAPEPLPRIAAELPLGEAEALLSVWRADRAKVALARQGLPRFEDLTPRYAGVALRADAPQALSLTIAAEDGPGQKARAAAARALGADHDAAEAHRALSRLGLLGADTAEAIEAMLLAQGAGDTGFTAGTWADLQSTAAGQASAVGPDLYKGLTEPLPELRPLSRGLADQLLARSEATAAAARALLARPAPDASGAAKP
ncbi:hypothetical protein [Falsigemmobacter faecalis]|uniref:Uncharacterized protein n=1 Tax=Falsigemmobacter faecalis TaxID=2488730 RepID=A0A3P3DQG1_9RHOB|nr:hypothetical protein [Falsigemmobacter faecalis]RRH75782.1 hypothetical protein EG244_07595 [Falsigemmobacter faecalis]